MEGRTIGLEPNVLVICSFIYVLSVRLHIGKVLGVIAPHRFNVQAPDNPSYAKFSHRVVSISPSLVL